MKMVGNNSRRKEHNEDEGGLWLSKCNVDPVEVQETQKRPRGRLDSPGTWLDSGPFHANSHISDTFTRFPSSSNHCRLQRADKSEILVANPRRHRFREKGPIVTSP